MTVWITPARANSEGAKHNRPYHVVPRRIKNPNGSVDVGFCVEFLDK
jgi:hypothetical protein